MFVFMLLNNAALIAQTTDLDSETVRNVIKKSYPASIKLFGIDSLSGKQNSPQFSGVVVTSDGVILTAAHAINSGNLYKVRFPNGKIVSAKALGRLGIKSMQGRPDVGMLKIVEKGDYPYAEMGWSNSMSNNDLCVSIAYPTTLNLDVPTVRVGKVSNALDYWGFLVSTCKMEPGDSGGPLFDSLGRVIGIHSRIDVDEDINFEAPINVFREYWDSLLQPVNYVELPSTKQEFISDLFKEKLVNSSNNHLKDLKPKGMVEIMNESNTILALGTLIDIKKKSFNQSENYSLIVTKSSLLKEPILVKINNKSYQAKILSINLSNDLALLKINISANNGISKIKEAKSFQNLGSPLYSVLSENKNELSSLGSAVFQLKPKVATGFFGGGANYINGKIIITSLSPDCPAAKGGLQLQDEVKFINGVVVTQPEHYGRELMQYVVGDTIEIKGLRNGNEFKYNVVLGKFPLSNHPSNKFVGGRSERFDNFEAVFAHDAKIKPYQCGGPVFTIDGTFVGINIARFSRTCSLAIPAEIVFDFVESYLSKNI